MKNYGRNINYFQNSKIDFENLDINDIYVGDIYKLVEKDIIIQSTKLKLVMKNAILLKIGFDRYINLSKIKSNLAKERIKKILSRIDYDNSKVVILGNFYKPYIGEQIVLNLKSYKELNDLKVSVKKLKKVKVNNT